MATPTEWYRENYLISTNASLIQPAAVNAAFGGGTLYWTKAMDEKVLSKMLSNSLCFGIYELPTSSADIAGRSSPRQIGLGRMITDQVSFAWLTDVYVLDEFQGKGLGSWLITCIDEVLSSWPELRRFCLITHGPSTFYEEKLKMQAFEQGKNGLRILNRMGSGSVLEN